jgi:hypothetical protein
MLDESGGHPFDADNFTAPRGHRTPLSRPAVAGGHSRTATAALRSRPVPDPISEFGPAPPEATLAPAGNPDTAEVHGRRART